MQLELGQKLQDRQREIEALVVLLEQKEDEQAHQEPLQSVHRGKRLTEVKLVHKVYTLYYICLHVHVGIGPSEKEGHQ